LHHDAIWRQAVPGGEAFAKKQFLSGLEQVKVFLDGRENKNIRLSESGWE